jgi:hypothetical protein
MFIILAHELYANKHKNQATYRKTQSFTYNKTREETLKIEYKQLKLVSDNFKSGVERENKTKNSNKITLKELKESKKIIDEDAHIKYNVYINAKIHRIIDINNTDEDTQNVRFFTNNVGQEIATTWKMSHGTIHVNDKSNIQDKVKEYIEVTLDHQYIYKVSIEEIHVNKEIYQPKQYRYIGGVKKTFT